MCKDIIVGLTNASFDPGPNIDGHGIPKGADCGYTVGKGALCFSGHSTLPVPLWANLPIARKRHCSIGTLETEAIHHALAGERGCLFPGAGSMERTSSSKRRGGIPSPLRRCNRAVRHLFGRSLGQGPQGKAVGYPAGSRQWFAHVPRRFGSRLLGKKAGREEPMGAALHAAKDGSFLYFPYA